MLEVWGTVTVLASIAILGLLVRYQAQDLKELKRHLNKAAKLAGDVKKTLEENSGPLLKLGQATDPKIDFIDRLLELERRADEDKKSLGEAINLRSTAHTELENLNTDLTQGVYDMGVDIDEVRVLVVRGSKPRRRLRKWAEEQAGGESTGNPSPVPPKGPLK
jgi:hypothetical protein